MVMSRALTQPGSGYPGTWELSNVTRWVNREALRGLRGGSDRGAQGRRGDPDHGLRQILCAGAQGQGGQKPPDRPEDEDRGPEGSLLQRGQRPQRCGLGALGQGVSLSEAMTKLGPCQVRRRTESPCPCAAEVEILGVAFCGPCARQQEAYFAIGELTHEDTEGLRGKALAEAMKIMRQERVGVKETMAAELHHGLAGARVRRLNVLPDRVVLT